MCLHEYRIGMEISGNDYPFYALIQAAMRQAEPKNLEMLRGCWPEVWDDLFVRYHTAGGVLESDLKEHHY